MATESTPDLAPATASPVRVEIEVLDERQDRVPAGSLRFSLPGPDRIAEAPKQPVAVEDGLALLRFSVHVECNVIVFFEEASGDQRGLCSFSLDPARPITRQTLIAYRSAQVVVRVRRPDGEPVAGATVTTHPAPDEAGSEAVVTDAGGEARVTAPVGNVEFRARSDEGWMGGSIAFLHPGEVRTVEIQARHSSRRLRVRCLSAGGPQYEGASVTAFLTVAGHAFRLPLTVDGEARTIAVPEEGRAWARVTFPDGESIPFRWEDLDEATAGGDELLLPLGPRSHVTLRLLSEGGVPLPGFRAQLVHRGAPEDLPDGAPTRWPFQSDPSGEAVIPHLAYGTYAVVPGWGERWRSQKTAPTRPGGHDHEEHDAEDEPDREASPALRAWPPDGVRPSAIHVRSPSFQHEVRFVGSSVLTGTLEGLDLHGGGPLSIQVDAARETNSDGHPLPVSERTVVGEGGRFAVTLPLPAGNPVRVRAVHRGVVLPGCEWKAESGRTDLRLCVEDGDLMLVEVRVRRGERGRVLGWLRLFLEADPSKSTPYRQIDRNAGSVTFEGLAPGTYRVEYARAMREGRVLLNERVQLARGTRDVTVYVPE